MSAKFYTLLTEIGAAKLASAAALGVPLKITKMAVGDGGGVLPTPSAQQTTLIAEKRRADLNMLYIDPQNSSQIIAEQVIPETEGGWWIREVGLFDETGALIAVGNCPESYKPQLAEGSGRTQTVRMVLITSSTDNITLKIDPAVVLATRKYVDDKVLELKVYVDDQMAKHIAAADPHSQYAPKESPTLTGTPKAPTAPAGTNTTQIASTAFVQAVVTVLNNALALKAPLASPALTGTPTAPTAAQTVNNMQVATTAFVKTALAALVGSSPAALDTLNELAAALGNDPNFATTMTNALAGKQPLDTTLTNLAGKTVSGLLDYLGLADISAAGVATGSMGSAGYAIFPLMIAGSRKTFVMQWGSLSPLKSGGSVDINLPIAFPTSFSQAFAIHDNALHWTRPTIYAISTTSRTTLTAAATCLTAGTVGGTVTRSTDDTACYGRYLAIGY
ncbi:phage tail protein [Escherichia coli]|nr:phage tail protein [Escherichia coli]